MLSSRAKYATRALLDLSNHTNEGPIQIHDIAERQNIPLKFLEQILLAMKRTGFVRSRKGPGGGYELAVPAEDIMLGAVVRALDGPLAPISCVSVSGYLECGCPDPEVCGLRTVWKEAREALVEVLDKTSFAEIRDREANIRHRWDQIIDFVI